MNATENNSRIDDMIKKTRGDIFKLREKREEDRDRFTEAQASLATRQHQCLEELNRLMQPKTYIPPCYNQAIQDISCLTDTPYILSKETELCQVLHQVEVTTNQLRILVTHHKSLVTSLERIIQEEIKKSEDNEDSLLKNIKDISVDMATLVTQKSSTLDQQEHYISLLLCGEKVRKKIDINLLFKKDCSSSFFTSSVVSSFFHPSKQSTEDNQKIKMVNKMERNPKTNPCFGMRQTTATAA